MDIVNTAQTLRHAATIGGVAAAVAVGMTCIVVGSFRALQVVHLIMLDRQGKCDYLPCVTDITYLAGILFALLTLAGAALLAGIFLVLVRRRSGP